MNSSRLRSVSAAPKLAITMMMTVLRRAAQPAEQQRVDEQRQAAVQHDGDERGDRQRPAEGERRRSASAAPPKAAPSAPATASAR